MAAWTYMLKCADGSYYVGCTTNIDERFGQHQAGEIPGYTSSRRPVEMIWADEFQTIHDAIHVERQLKGWSRAKKEALARGDWDALQRLAKRAQKWCVVRDAPFGALLTMTNVFEAHSSSSS